MSPKILIVDDSRFARLKIEEVLRSRGVCVDFAHAENGAQGAGLLAEHQFDLVLCDINMPESDGFAFLQRKSDANGLEDVPVIMLTGEEEIEIKLNCLSAGASDYLLKPFHEEELVARAKIHLQLKELRDSLRTKNQALERLIRVDPLTAVANRLHLGECLRREFSRGQRHEQPFSLAILDVDHFKMVNDRFGHQVGDQVLREIALRLCKAVRAHDVVARYGGEEFALLAPHTGTKEATLVVERCRQLVSGTPFAVGEPLKITVSAGVSSYPTNGAESEDELLRQADQALYEAKRSGRDRMVCWETQAEA